MCVICNAQCHSKCPEWNSDDGEFCCSKCTLGNLPFNDIDDNDLEYLLSGMTEESYRRYTVCSNIFFTRLTLN